MSKLSVPAIILWIVGLIIIIFVMFFLAASLAIAFVGLLLIIAFFLVNGVFSSLWVAMKSFIHKLTGKKRKR